MFNAESGSDLDAEQQQTLVRSLGGPFDSSLIPLFFSCLVFLG